MSSIREHISPLRPQTFLQEEVGYATDAVKATNAAKVYIRGDLCFYITEQEIVQGFMTGRYSIETQEMQKPLYILWHAEGKVFSPRWPSTDIAFDLRGAQAGQVLTYMVQVQVMDQNGRHCIVSGVFVQIFVMGEFLPQSKLLDYPGYAR